MKDLTNIYLEDQAQRRTGSQEMNNTPVPIFQHDWEFRTLLELYRLRAPQKVLEIGTYYGGTLYHWIKNSYRGVTIVSVDLNNNPEYDNRHLYDTWYEETDMVELHVITGNSDSYAIEEKVEQFAPFDWIFIDAGHFYKEVKADWKRYGKMAGHNAVVAFHDICYPSNHPHIQVKKLWREIQKQGYITQELVIGPKAQEWGIGVVYL